MGLYTKRFAEKVFSLVVSSDGAPVLKSRKFNVLASDGVPYIILTGLWYAKSKPDMKLFSKHFVSEVNECSKWCEFDDDNDCPALSVMLIQSVVPDLPAKAILLNTTQYNGKFGCGTCKHPGRYDNQVRARLEKWFLSEQGKSVFGKLVALPDNAPIDWMHCVCEGIQEMAQILWNFRWRKYII